MEQNSSPKAPREAFSDFFETVSFGDILWIFITISLGLLLYWFAKEQRKKEVWDWTSVLKWLAIFAGTTALIIFLVSYRISEGDPSSWMYFGIVTLISNITVYYMDKNLSDVEKIIIGAMVIITGFAMLIFFALGNVSACWAIAFGIFEGFSFGMLVLSFKKLKLNKRGESPYDDDDINVR